MLHPPTDKPITGKSETGLNDILLIDDDQVTNYLHHIILQEVLPEVTIEVKHNGEEAFNFIKSFFSTGLSLTCLYKKMPQLIFVDIHMPVLDGFGFLRKINDFYSQKGEKRQVKIFILSSSLAAQDIILAKQLGSDGYIEKPLTSDKILSLVAAHFS